MSSVMPRVIDRRVFQMFRTSTVVILSALLPILTYLVLFEAFFIEKITVLSGPDAGKVMLWAQLHFAVFVGLSILLIGSWVALFTWGRTMRKDAVAEYLGKLSRKEMTTYEYRAGVIKVRKTYREQYRQ